MTADNFSLPRSLTQQSLVSSTLPRRSLQGQGQDALELPLVQPVPLFSLAERQQLQPCPPQASRLVIPQPAALPHSVSVSHSVSSRPSWLAGTGLSDQDEQTLVDYVGSSIRDSTKMCYSRYWKRFKEFCSSRNVSYLPAAPAVVARFLIFIAEQNASVSGAKLASSAISYFHKIFMGDNVSPTDSVIVKNVIKSITEKFAKPVKKAKPFTSVLLKDLLDFYFSSDVRSKNDETLVVMISVMFCLMARHEEVSKLTKDCVKILDSGDIEVNFPSAKNYNFSDAKKSFIASCPNAKYNIAQIFKNYVSNMLPGTILFPLSYNSALSQVRKLLCKAGISNDDSFSLHSFRVGAVSEAVNDGLISDSDVQRHARWNSLEMLYRYRCQTLENQLRASRMLLISRM